MEHPSQALRSMSITGLFDMATAVWGLKSKGEQPPDPVRVEGAWEALSSREVFEQVRKSLHKRAESAAAFACGTS